MELDKFLRTPRFSHDREAMLMHKLIYDCRLALAQLNDRLQVLIGEVDHDGYDVLFDDSDNHKQFQVKVVYGKAQSWSVHRRLLRPTSEIAEWFAFPSTPEGIGLDGGFIVQELEISSSGDLVVHYHYTDLYVLRAFDLEILSTGKAARDKKIRRLFYDLKRGYGLIKIPKFAMLPVRNARDLLSLAGFNMNSDAGIWRGLLRRVSGRHGMVPGEIVLPMSEEKTKQLIGRHLTKLRAPNRGS